MIFNLIKFALFFSLFLTAFAPHTIYATSQQQGEEEDSIIVHLSTQSNLSPIYLAEIKTTDESFKGSYLQSLYKILAFDFNVNGMTQALPHTSERKLLIEKEADKNAINPRAWRDLNVLYVIKPQIQDKMLTLRVYSIDPPTYYEFKDIALSGDLNSDRRKIHQLSDAIFKHLFQSEGVASTHILYTIKVKKPNSTSNAIAEVWECDYDGGNPRQVTHENRLCVTPSYIPSKHGHVSSSFFYVCYRVGQPKIYMASLNDGIGRPITDLKGNQLMPVASPKRDCVAFICDISGNPDLFLQPYNMETGKKELPRQIYASLRGVQGTPSFSPDGKRIAFVSNKDGSPRIYVIDIPPAGLPLKDIKAIMISKRNKENTSPSWSPDGTMLAYSSMTDGTREIWIYDFSTREEKQLTQGPGHKENPSWAPDSLHLVFNSDSPELGSADLYLINLNSTEAKKITSGTGEKRFPSWEPRP